MVNGTMVRINNTVARVMVARNLVTRVGAVGILFLILYRIMVEYWSIDLNVSRLNPNNH